MVTFSVKHGGTCQRLHKGKILTQYKGNYITVGLYDNTKKVKSNTHSVHVLVAQAFLDNPSSLGYVNHKDLDKHNNYVDNLEWTTGSGNIVHAIENGVVYGQKGENNAGAKLTDDRVRFIRKNAKTKGGTMTSTELAEMFGVGTSLVKAVARGERWKHVQ